VTKYVASNTLTKHEWSNTVFLKGNVVEEIKKLKQQDGLPAAHGGTAQTGPDLQVHGSGIFIQTLLQHDLVDEFWLKIFSITLGKGKRLFGEGVIPAAFKLTDSKVSPKGVIIASYQRAGKSEVSIDRCRIRVMQQRLKMNLYVAGAFVFGLVFYLIRFVFPDRSWSYLASGRSSSVSVLKLLFAFLVLVLAVAAIVIKKRKSQSE